MKKWQVWGIKGWGHTVMYDDGFCESAEEAFDSFVMHADNYEKLKYFNAVWVQEIKEGAKWPSGPRTGFTSDPKIVYIHDFRSILDSLHAHKVKTGQWEKLPKNDGAGSVPQGE